MYVRNVAFYTYIPLSRKTIKPKIQQRGRYLVTRWIPWSTPVDQASSFRANHEGHWWFHAKQKLTAQETPQYDTNTLGNSGVGT